MSWPRVPIDNVGKDWPRQIAKAVNYLIGRESSLTDTVAVNSALVDQFAALADYADDTAAAAGGVAVGEYYRTASVVKVRVA